MFEYESPLRRGVQHYVIKFVSDLRQVGGFLKGTPVSSTNIIDHLDIAKILLKVALIALHMLIRTIKYA